MPLVQTRGAASAQGFGEFAQATAVNYIEEVFSTYTYTGNGSTQTITNDIDLSTKGGMVWIKSRTAAEVHSIRTTNGGVSDRLRSDTGAVGYQGTTGDFTSFNTNGFTLGAPTVTTEINNTNIKYASWTFRKQPKFFDVQTWTGSGANRTISHSLGSVPACIMVKRTDTAGDWQVYHRSLANTEYLVLNSTAAKATGATRWNSTTPTSSVFSLGTDATVNASAGTYVAYIFAHDAGGFGLLGTDNVISCGSYTEGASATTVTLGYEPQWLLVKKSSATSGWELIDNMRGFDYSDTKYLEANTAAAEVAVGSSYFKPTPTGFIAEPAFFGNGSTIVYIAIRRGPMKVPTLGTTVYGAVARTGTGATASITSVSFPPDLVISDNRDSGNSPYFWDRLRGAPAYVSSASTGPEDRSQVNSLTAFLMNGMSLGSDGSGLINGTGTRYINWFFKRAPGFFDEVCYTGTGTLGQTYSHNLGVAPELIILKCRAGGSYNWPVWNTDLAASGSSRVLYLNVPQAFTTSNGEFNSTAPTASVFTVGNNFSSNGGTGYTYVAYLFATCAGVSKVGTYTGTGTTQTINCGFTAGSRFIMIKRIDVTGDWYVWDSTRGLVPGNDPYLLLNSSTTPEDTGTDYVDTANSGFEVTSTAPATINANGGTFLFLAIA